jgi:hypothetical protein
MNERKMIEDNQLKMSSPLCNYIHKCGVRDHNTMSTIRMIEPPPKFNLPQPPNPISFLHPTILSALNEKFLLHYLNVNSSSSENNQIDKCNYFKIHQFKSSKNNVSTGSNSSLLSRHNSSLPKLVFNNNNNSNNYKLSSITTLIASTKSMHVSNNRNFIKHNAIKDANNHIYNHLTTNTILNSNNVSNGNSYFQHNFYVYSAITLLTITLIILAFYFLFAR